MQIEFVRNVSFGFLRLNVINSVTIYLAKIRNDAQF